MLAPLWQDRCVWKTCSYGGWRTNSFTNVRNLFESPLKTFWEQTPQGLESDPVSRDRASRGRTAWQWWRHGWEDKTEMCQESTGSGCMLPELQFQPYWINPGLRASMHEHSPTWGPWGQIYIYIYLHALHSCEDENFIRAISAMKPFSFGLI